MDEKLARSVADELVKVVWVSGGTWGRSRGTWAVSFGAGHYRLMYDRKETADDVAEALRMLAIAAITRYNGASPAPEITEVSESPVPPGGLMPDLFAGELEAMSKILARVSGLLGEEARRLVDLRQAAAGLVVDAEDVAHSLPPVGSLRNRLLHTSGVLSAALAALSKE